MNTRYKKSRTLAGVSTARWTAYAAAGLASAVTGATSAEAIIHVVGVNEAFDAPLPANDTSHSSVPPGDRIGFYNITGSAYLGVRNRVYSLGDSRAARVGIANFGMFYAAGNFNGFAANGYQYVSKLAAGANIAALPFAPLLSAYFNHGTLAFGQGGPHSQWHSRARATWASSLTRAQASSSCSSVETARIGNTSTPCSKRGCCQTWTR